MATNLYREAIAEAKQLREMAEQNAKNKIVDAVTPQIRQLIEAQLLGEQDGEEINVDIEDMESALAEPDAVAQAPEEVAIEPAVLDLDAMAVPADVAVQTSDSAAVSIPAGVSADIEVGLDGSVNVDTGIVDLEVGGSGDVADEEDLILSTESVRALVKLLKQPKLVEEKELIHRLIALAKGARRLDRVLEGYDPKSLSPSQREIVRNRYRKMLREAITLRKHVILSEVESNTQGLNERANLVFKEIQEMAKRRSSALFENKRQRLAELDAVLSLAPADEDEAVEVEELLGDLEVEFELEPAEEGGDEGEEELDLDLGGEEEVEVEEVVEIDEAMLRRELRRMRALREQEEGRAAEADPALAHGGEDEGDSFVDVDEDALLNALADELGDPDVPEPEAPPAAVGAGETDAMPEAFRRKLRRRLAERSRTQRRGRRSAPRGKAPRGKRVNESRRNRALSGKLNEYRKAVGSLRGQLDEMNLFNAKLLYANKLMQNRNVTPKQQRVIVEALDNAKTIREAKLLYQSLTASLNKKGGTLTEGRARRTLLGSASKSARSAQPANGDGSIDRWAVLAGLGKDK
jgi:hypothetical protein